MGASADHAQPPADDGAIALGARCEGCGPPLIMLGGGTMGAAGFAAHARELAGEFRVIRLETLNVERGHSGQPLPRDYSIRLEAQCAGRAIERLGLTQPIDVVGHSLGALIALDFALEKPRRVRSLTLSEPPAFWVVSERERSADPVLWNMRAIVRRFRPAIEPSDEDLVACLRGLGEANVAPPGASEPSRAAWEARRRCLRGLSAVADHVDDMERLRHFRRPVLLVEGNDTAPFHRRINARLACKLPCMERVALAGGHSSPLTARKAFLQALREFLARAGGSRPINRS